MLNLTGYKLTFDEEFNTRSISHTGDGTTWADSRDEWRQTNNGGWDMGFGDSAFVSTGSGYDPFKVEAGQLIITAVPDRTPAGSPGAWESGLVTTQGNFSQTYGYFEMRAQLANEIGAWDAFWLLPNKPADNPKSLPGHQELDIVEHYGSNEGGLYSFLHTTDPTPAQELQYYSSHSGLTSGYHTYGVDWQSDKISFYFDGQYMGSRETPSDMHGPMYIIANLATENKANNNPNAAGVPITFMIDYFRVYSKDANAVAVTKGVVSAPDGQDPGLYGATSLVKGDSLIFAADEYLAANPDVAKAGIDPLTHHQQYGWKEGRDPSASFDDQLYLVHNTDVLAAGIDPFTHYLQYGHAEGRPVYAAVGKAGDLATHSGFDAEYYLLSNGDVAKASLASGGDAFAFAYQHYETYGWHEGRNPNAVFDTKGYLATYNDVAAANIDPLSHYDQYGWHEGRDPSANFDTKAYGAAYADVKAAGLDPMLHYLQYGAVEGRSAFADEHFA